MMKQILPLLFSLLFISVATAQTNAKSRAFFTSGVELKSKNMLAEAMVAFKKAIALNKKYDSAYAEIASIHLKNGKTDSAIINFTKAITLNSKMSDAFIALGNIYRDFRPNYDSSLICYNGALTTDSLNKVTYYSIAWIYNAKGKYENAIAAANKALAIDNNYRPAYSELGHAYRKSNNYQGCIEECKKHLAISIVDLPLYYMGLCYTELKNKEEALKTYEELKKVNEKMAGALKKTIDKMQ